MLGVRKSMSPQQRRVYGWIEDYVYQHKYPPTYREIGEAFEITTKAVFDHVQALERKGYIEKLRGKPRTIRLMGGHDVNE